MIFSSIQYLIFLPIVVMLYWRTRGAVRLCVLVAASYFFYMSWLPIFGVLLFVMTTLNWVLGLGIERAREKGRVGATKGLLSLGLLVNLGCLGYYKYADFFLSNCVGGMNWVARLLAVPAPFAEWSPLGILLPLGISFFVFEFVHYVVDVYKGDKAVKSWLEFAAFAAFFPSQIAGPIKRYQEFVEWIRKPLPFDQKLFAEAGTLIVQGMFKKVAIADPFGAIIYNSYATLTPLSCPDAWIASIGFMIQCYCDFSGYTDIGRGSALLMGIRLPLNFELPYLAQDMADYWRRWHMSLGSWLRDYVYIPIGGSRGKLRIHNWFTLMTTMTVCGLWHGAAWHFIWFGSLNGLGICISREWQRVLKHVKWLGTVCDTAPVHCFNVVLTFVWVMVTYTMFRAPNVPIAMNVLGCWFSPDMNCTLWMPMVKSGVLALLSIYMAFWLGTEALKKYKPIKLDAIWGVYPNAVRYASWTAALFLIVAARPTVATPFVYFQF